MAEQGAAICNANVQCLVVLSEDLSTDEISAGGNLDQDYLMLQTSNDMDNSQHTIGAKVETCVRGRCTLYTTHHCSEFTHVSQTSQYRKK